MHYYEVAPTTIVRADAEHFTYSSNEPLDVGTICSITIGKKAMLGVVLKKTSKPTYDVKSVENVLEQPPLPPELVQTALWLSSYYATHLATVWQTVLPRGLTKTRRQTSPLPQENSRKRTHFVFTKEQQDAIDKIQKSEPGTMLLHGATGSGKTAVYIEAAKDAIAAHKSVIVLVPEIALTSQLIAEFSHHFEDVVVAHSRQTEANRHTTWLQVLNATKPQVVVGPRSALFMPLKNIGLVVIDECHEPSFKQEKSPRYSALRLAATLTSNHDAKLILGSATPNIADYYQAERSGAQIISMPTPARTDTTPPITQVVDMTKRDNFHQHHFLSDQLLAHLKNTFARNEQALIFHNRRGTASTTLCSNCGWSAGCPRCFVPLTLHADQHKLSCHVCGLKMNVPTSCPECHNADIIHRGIGTKRIEQELAKLFPEQTIARFDGDTADDDTVEKRYHELYSGKIDLIIGTQVIAKGLDLPHLRTVGVVQADAGLSLPDYTSSERTFQLLAQVVGRIGRSHHATNLIVQSFQPNHPAVQDGIKQNYTDFYDRTIDKRQRTNFPPFTHLLKLTCIYKTEAAAVRNARALQKTLQNVVASDLEILGPTPAFYERMRDTYRWQLVIKSPRRQDLLELLTHVPSGHWQYELDPLSLL